MRSRKRGAAAIGCHDSGDAMRQRSGWRPVLLGAGLLFLWSSPAVGYRILFDQVHETITRAAVDCLRRHGDAMPAGCALDRNALRRLSGRNSSPWKVAVRWPDDPLRQTNPVSGAQAGINVVLGRCADLVARHRDDLQRAGLPCRSHYGDLQFLHAMRSSPGERPEDTREKMLAWARFTYRVARGEVAADANFCDQFQGGSVIDGAMVPPNFPYCSRQSDGWTVGEFFTFSCPIGPGRCNVSPEPSRVRTTAAGALLHLIQDSYSQSHVLRTDSPQRDGRGVLVARIECGAPRHFEHYNAETSRTHGKADGWPVLAENCLTGGRADPVTASAVALHLLENERSADELVRYLSTHVF